MSKRIKVYFIILVGFWGSIYVCDSHWPLLGLPEALATPQTAWPHEKSDLPPEPGMVFGRLDNGFRYVLMRNQNPKDRVSMHLNIQAGSTYELDSQQGLAPLSGAHALQRVGTFRAG